MSEEWIQELCEAIAKREATLVRAEILDQDNQRLATGKATPTSDGVHQVFYISNPEGADTLSARAAILLRSDETMAEIVNCKLCEPVRFPAFPS